jgi:hypothetical protein
MLRQNVVEPSAAAFAAFICFYLNHRLAPVATAVAAFG